MSRSVNVLWLLLFFLLLCGCAKLPDDLGVLPTPHIPSAPFIDTVTVGNGSATVSWSGGKEAASFNLYYKAGTTVDTTNGTMLAGVTSPWQVTGLTNGTEYAFAVAAVNVAGESELSAVQTATPQAGSGTVTDIDGNVYHTVTIGTQTWMVENLKTTKYNDGSVIPPVTDNTAWSNLGTPGYCWYNNDSVTNKATYGALYNWYAVNTKKLAPTGWHVPTDSEWTVLENWLTINGYNYDGTTTGNKYAKSLASQTNWTTSTTTGAVGNNLSTNNRTGFSALPGGYRYGSGAFDDIGGSGNWWSATADGAASAWYRGVDYYGAFVVRSMNVSQFGFSVRCVRDSTYNPPTVPVISSATAGDSSVTVSWNTVAGATSYNLYYKIGAAVTIATGTKLTGVTSPKQVVTLTNGTQYAFAVSAVNAGGESGLSTIQTATPLAAFGGTVTDACGNVYHTVVIGSQEWMVENLETTKYKDGSPIPLVTDGAAWSSLTTPGYCYYGNDSVTNKVTYGALYNWFAVSTGNLAPTGWHVSTDAEWSTLTTYLLGETVAGGKLKSTTLWTSPNTGATNETGFSALPGGCRTIDGTFLGIGTNGLWWCATAGGGLRGMAYGSADVSPGPILGSYTVGFSVRCVRDNNPNPPSAPVISSAVAGDGGVTVSWDTVTGATSYNLYYKIGTTVTIATGTKLTGVTSPKQVTTLTNGTQYAFAVSAVNAGGESGLSAVQTATPQAGRGTVSDTDGNVYQTVTIGTQVWLAENLKTTRYNDGAPIPKVTDSTAWSNLTTPGYCWYNNDSITNANTYGALYNWYTVNTGNLAPTGWHVATDAEWTTLTTYLGGESVAGGKLKEAGLAHWSTPNTSATNETGFSALPGGYHNSDPNPVYPAFRDFGNAGVWWSATGNASGAWGRSIGFSGGNLGRSYYGKSYGFSVRCVRDNNPNPPSAPVISSAVAGDGGVTVSWNTVTGATSYNLYYSAGSTVTTGGTKVTGATSPYVINGLTNGTQYAFAVSAVNGVGESGLSVAGRATPVTGCTSAGITTQPAAQSVIAPAPGTFTVVATGTSPTYQWQRAEATSPTVFANVSGGIGATTAAYTTVATAIASDNGALYRCVISGQCGTAATSNGAALTVTAASGGTVTDACGNVYHTVVIGSQEWMVENLKTTKYKDGSPIPLVTDRTAWSALTTPGYCYYGNDSVTNKVTYGALYNWFAVSTGNLAPTGWHVPTDAEWSTLTTYLLGETVAGGKLKSTTLWTSPNTGATNETGFTALPGGYRSYDGAFLDIGGHGCWWSATASGATNAWYRDMYYYNAYVYRNYDDFDRYGFSVRCVRD